MFCLLITKKDIPHYYYYYLKKNFWRFRFFIFFIHFLLSQLFLFADKICIKSQGQAVYIEQHVQMRKTMFMKNFEILIKSMLFLSEVRNIWVVTVVFFSVFLNSFVTAMKNLHKFPY